MFFRKKPTTNEKKDNEEDIWGREPLALYEKVGRLVNQDEERVFFTNDGKNIEDLMVLFHNGKPDIRGVGALLYVGEWINYGTKLYRVNTTLSVAELEALIIEELHLTKAEFLVSRTFIDPRWI
ncbi:hypothetical protein [Enterococcus sp.]|uniref:hypothetical protein n=1 Tax=Enterococcus sp. TaxID=35783 RepID=UPI002913F1E1|nr:hypothetical protein [Enterococcus sp.]MDU5337201.1 hypothetical protein [Enterococcus sp.]